MRLSTAELSRNNIIGIVSGTGADMSPGTFLSFGVAAPLDVDLAHVGPDRVVHDPVHDSVGRGPRRASGANPSS